MKKLNIGIVGLGRLGKEYANNIQFKVPNANLIAACSLNKEEMEFAKNKLEVKKIYSDFDKMLTNLNLEAIVIISSTNVHAEQIIKAMNKGLHVFCEKPLGVDIKECLMVEEEDWFVII